MLALVSTPQETAKVQLRELAPPTPLAHQAVVDVRAVSLNRGEVGMLAGRDGWRPGWDLAGTVVAASKDGTGPAVGARVVGYVGEGAWAQKVAVPTKQLAVIPEEVSFASAAVLPIAGLTALRALSLGGLLLGRKVLVTGGAGGVGRFAIQLAAKSGAHVTAIVGRKEREAGLRALGASEVAIGFEEAKGDYDVILESAGGASLAHALGHVAPGGVIVNFGNSSGENASVDVVGFFVKNAATLRAFVIFHELERTASASRDLAILASLVARGELEPQVSVETSWRTAGPVISALLERRVSGKAVLHLD